jgi:PAS domain S-box-containing protein
MNNRPLSSLSSPLNWGAIRIAGIYLLIGSLWILFSDRLAEKIALDKEMLASLSLYKGWGFMIVTAFLLYWLIQGHTSRLHASEKQLQVVINALPVLISYIDKSRCYQFTNEAYEEWFGEKAQGKHIEELIGQTTYQKISKYVDKALNGETVFYETEIPYQDGGERFVSATYIPDMDVDGHVRGFFALVQDISEQKEAKEKLRQWGDAFEGCAHGIAIADPDTNRITVCNPAFANMHKCRVEDIVGSSILSLYAPSDHEHVRGNMEKADQIGHARYEARMVRKDRSIFPAQMDLVSVLGDDGELIYRVATAQDISEGKQAEEKIIYQARLLEQVNDAVLATDEHFTITSWNSAAERIFGWKAKEAIGRKGEEILQTEFFNKTRSDALQEIKETGEFSAEVTQLRRDGSRIHIETRTVALRDERGQITGYVSINRDITGRKQAEEQLERNNQILNEILESIQDDFYVLDHDWNFVYASRLFTSKVGKEPQDFIGKNIWKLFPKHLGTVLEVNFREAMEKREIQRFETGGKYTSAWYRMTAFPSAEGITVLGTDITERKHTEEELKRSEERYRYLFQNNPYPMWIYDRKTLAFLDVNEAAITKYGYSRQEFQNMTLVDIRPSQDVELLMKNLAQPRRPLEHSDGWRHCLKDGTVIYVEITSHTLEMDGHESVFVIAQDITERVQAQNTLRLKDELLRLTSEMAKVGGWEFDPQTGKGTWTDEVARIHDLDPAEETNVEIGLRYYVDESRQKIEQAVKDAIELARPYDLELELISAKGNHKWVRTMALPIMNEGRIIKVQGIFQDITERKQIEEALQKAHDELEIKVQERTSALSQANALLQALMDTMPDQIYFKDLQCRFIRNSRSQASLLGLSDPVQVVGKTDFDFFPHASKAYADEQEVMRSGKPLIDFEEWVVWPDGRESWVSTTKVPLRNTEGETIGIFGISRDITERKHAEQAIRELNSDLENQAAKLQAANRELEAFSYSVSHDLRAPLRAIDGYTRILVEDYEALLDAEGKRVCGIISAEARRMGQLIDDLLAFSRLGRKEMYSSNINMKALVVSALNELMKEKDRERINFKIARLPSISADSSLMRQVWVNLLSNALKFTSKKESAVIEVGSKSSRDEVIYYVRDSGAGFDMEYANKLFGVFQRLHSESEFEGTGVGLAIIQRIIRRHGGRVWAEGEVDKGATFYFALPRKENHHE